MKRISGWLPAVLIALPRSGGVQGVALPRDERPCARNRLPLTFNRRPDGRVSNQVPILAKLQVSAVVVHQKGQSYRG